MSADADPRDPRSFSTASPPTSPAAPHREDHREERTAPRADASDGGLGDGGRDASPATLRGAAPDEVRAGDLDAPYDARGLRASGDPRLAPLARPPGAPPAAPVGAPSEAEAIRRVPVDEEDRLAFRVGVNLLVLLALAALAWWGARSLGWLGG